MLATSTSLSSASSTVFHCHLSLTAYNLLLPPFRHLAAMSPLLPQVQHALVSPLPLFFCPVLRFLPLPFCHDSFTHLCHLCHLSRSSSDSCQRSTFLCPFLCKHSLQSKVYDPSVSLLARILIIFFSCSSNIHWSACVIFLLLAVGIVATL